MWPCRCIGKWTHRYVLGPWAGLGWLTCLLAVCLSGSAPAAQAADEEAVISRYKTAFLYHFTSYVTWPEAAQDSVFVVGVLGDSPVLPLLESLAEKKEVGNKLLVVRQLSTVDEARDCHMLFVTKAFEGPAARIDSVAAANSVLTVTDLANVDHCTIRFVMVDGKLKFAVDKDALRRADLRASANLLKLAIAE